MFGRAEVVEEHFMGVDGGKGGGEGDDTLDEGELVVFLEIVGGVSESSVVGGVVEDSDDDLG